MTWGKHKWTFPARFRAGAYGWKASKLTCQRYGVIIRSWPAIHSLDGSVSYGLEWNGWKYVFGGDTYPNKWYIDYAKDADVASHECFLPRTNKKQPGEFIQSGKWKGYTPPPMPEK